MPSLGIDELAEWLSSLGMVFVPVKYYERRSEGLVRVPPPAVAAGLVRVPPPAVTAERPLWGLVKAERRARRQRRPELFYWLQHASSEAFEAGARLASFRGETDVVDFPGESFPYGRIPLELIPEVDHGEPSWDYHPPR